MREGMKEITEKQAGAAVKGTATLRAQNGKVFCSSRGKKEGVAEHDKTPGTPTTNERFYKEFEEEIDAWAEANVEESRRSSSGSKESWRMFTRRKKWNV